MCSEVSPAKAPLIGYDFRLIVAMLAKWTLSLCRDNMILLRSELVCVWLLKAQLSAECVFVCGCVCVAQTCCTNETYESVAKLCGLKGIQCEANDRH